MLFPAAVLAAPTWLECSGNDQRFTEGKSVAHTIQVMFDQQDRVVAIRDSAFNNLSAEKVEITSAQITGSSPVFSIGIDRQAATFGYHRFANGVSVSRMNGTCKVAPAPAPQKF